MKKLFILFLIFITPALFAKEKVLDPQKWPDWANALSSIADIQDVSRNGSNYHLRGEWDGDFFELTANRNGKLYWFSRDFSDSSELYFKYSMDARMTVSLLMELYDYYSSDDIDWEAEFFAGLCYAKITDGESGREFFFDRNLLTKEDSDIVMKVSFRYISDVYAFVKESFCGETTDTYIKDLSTDKVLWRRNRYLASSQENSAEPLTLIN